MSEDKYKMIVEELRDWLIMGIHCLKDTGYQENPRLLGKIEGMEMVLSEIDRLKG